MPAEPAKTYLAKTLDHNSPLIACRFDPTGKFLFVGAEDFRVWRWDHAAGTKVEYNPESWVRSLAFNKPGDVLITGGFDGRLIWWPATVAEKPAAIRTVDAHKGMIRAIAVSPDGQFLASCGNDLKVKLWKVEDGSLVREMTGHERHIWNVAFHPNGKDLVTGDLVSKFIHWELESGKAARTIPLPALTKYDPSFMADHGGPHSMAFNADGSRLACGGVTNVTNAFAGVGNPAIVVVDWAAGKEAIMHLTKGNIQAVAWGTVQHPEGFTIGATGSGAGNLFFWKPDQKDEFHSFALPTGARDMALHPDLVTIATVHHDSKIRLSVMAAKPA